MNEQEFLSIRRAAKALHIAPASLKEAVACGELQAAPGGRLAQANRERIQTAHLATEKFELAVLLRRTPPIAGANRGRIRTAQLGNREKRGPRRILGPEPPVSGSDTRGLDGQDPAESRGFLGLFPNAGAKSLQQQTEWRWAQSGANSSLRPYP